jgi:hypothetical protein
MADNWYGAVDTDSQSFFPNTFSQTNQHGAT